LVAYLTQCTTCLHEFEIVEEDWDGNGFMPPLIRPTPHPAPGRPAVLGWLCAGGLDHGIVRAYRRLGAD
jgi:hypothetical protein